ncbi:MAG: 4-alpha-glucanotransferase [Woeseiaceae bacterium]
MQTDGIGLLSGMRAAGVCLHITSLPGPHGIGVIGPEARQFIDRMAAAGLRVWQILPTGPTAYGDSPYQPLSTFAGNPMMIDLRELVDWQLLTTEELVTLNQLPRTHTDYESLIPQKWTLLETAASRFTTLRNEDLQLAYRQFLETNDRAWLNDYALFRALKLEHDERPWTEWAVHFRQRDIDALREFSYENADRISLIKFVEFVFDHQWRSLQAHAKQAGVLLFGDIPIYIALDSADAWANQSMLRLDTNGLPTAVAGVPPDYFSEDGQLWGNPLYDWSFHAEQDFRWWVDRIRHALRQADLVRIDHFRGFEAYWSIPAGDDTARHGHWETGPNDAIFNAIKTALGDVPIVAEDLGEITPAVEALRVRHHLPGMAVLQFLVDDPCFDLKHIAKDRICYTGTHDNDTTVGWFNGNDDDTRTPEQIAHTQSRAIAVSGGTPDDIHWAMIHTAFASPACLAIVPMQDFLGLGSEARFNTPGKPANNWGWRMQDHQFSDAICERISQMVTSCHR